MVVESRQWTAIARNEAADGATGREVDADPQIVYRYSPAFGAAIVATFALLCAVFWKAIGWLWDSWTSLPEYSHGPMLPLVASFLVWQQKDQLERLEFRGSWWGPLLVVGGGMLYFLGVLGSAYTVQQYAFVATIAGLALALTGRRGFALLGMPLLALVLMVPQPQFILSNLSSQLQLISSAIGVAVIRALGITVFLEGNVIDLGTYKLQVVDACAGLRYLFPLMALGLLVGYFYKGAPWKRVTVFVASIPLTILMNSLRVGIIGALVEYWGVGMAEGFLHEFQGWAVFMLSAVLLVGLTALLNRIGVERGTWRQLFGLEMPRATPAGAARTRRAVPGPFLLAAAVIGAIAVGSALVSTRAEIVPPRQSFATFPLALGAWSGVRGTIGGEVLDALQLDDYVLGDFRRADDPPVNLYVAYYATQRDRRTAHSPRSCIPAGGWRITESTVIRLPESGTDARRMVITNGDARELVYYWFEQRGRTITNEYAVKWWLFWDSVSRGRSDGALVRLITPLSPSDSIAAADRRLQEVARLAIARLPAFVPR